MSFPSFLDRRNFLALSLLGTIGIYSWYQMSRKHFKPYEKQVQILLHSAYHLFPRTKGSIGAEDLHMLSYIAGVLEDERIMPEDKSRWLKQASWIEERSQELYQRSFLALEVKEKEHLFQSVTQMQWGRAFVYETLNYVFEALISAPIYGSNLNKIGWKWLKHNPGFPQPQSIEEIRYGL